MHRKRNQGRVDGHHPHRSFRSGPAGNKVPTILNHDFNLSGVSNLPSDITAAGSTVSPSWRYEGQDATTGTWTATVGTDLTGGGSGGSVSQAAPFTDGTKAVDHDGTRYWQATSGQGLIGTKDFVFEMVVRNSASAGNVALCASGTPGVTACWYFSRFTGGACRFNLTDAAGGADPYISIPALAVGWHHIMIFVDRSTAGRAYVNGAYVGQVYLSAAAAYDLTVDASLTLGAYAAGTAIPPAGSDLAFFSGWTKASWLADAFYTAIAAERFQKLCGTYDSDNSVYPTFTRAAAATCTVDSTAHDVGPRWPRISDAPSGGYGLEIKSADGDSGLMYAAPAIDTAKGSMVATTAFTAADQAASDFGIASLNDGGATTDRIEILTNDDVAHAESAATAGDAGSVTGTTDIVDGADHVSAVSWEANNLQLFVDGTEEGTADTSVTVPSNIDQFHVGENANGDVLDGWVKTVKVYKKTGQKR